jgi:hypothetical protein
MQAVRVGPRRLAQQYEPAVAALCREHESAIDDSRREHGKALVDSRKELESIVIESCTSYKPAHYLDIQNQALQHQVDPAQGD